MEKVKIDAILREKSGKEVTKKLRKEGSIPAVIYGKETNLSVQIPHQGLRTLKSIHFSESTVIEMVVSNNKKHETFPVIIKDIQHHPLTDEVIHLDFLKVSLKEKITVHIPIVFRGEAKGAKEGGTLEQLLWELEVEGLPMDIPEKVEIDISGLEIGHSLHVSDVTITGDVEIVTPAEDAIVTVSVKKVEEEVVPAEEEAVPQEPEVIKEKKEVPEEEGAKKEEKPKKEEKKES
ncbi:MAG: 50S ribosomal protein L25 [Candidatus Omnitrophota bacterium]|nr:MAG: 50S ribosomal protein L25 [Candidatus Omnitrophota bacterium]